MSRSIITRGIAALVLLGIVAAVFLLLRSNDGARERSDPLPSGDLPVSAEANELASLVQEGQGRTYHAVYSVKAPESDEQDEGDQSVEIETWRRDDLVRWDETIRAGDRVVRTSSYRLEDRSVSCTRQDDEEWRCQPLPAASSDGDPVIGRIADELAGKAVEAKDDEVAGHRARCFAIREGQQRADVCLTDSGIPVVYRVESASLELVELDEGTDAVSDDVFEPPAG